MAQTMQQQHQQFSSAISCKGVMLRKLPSAQVHFRVFSRFERRQFIAAAAASAHQGRPCLGPRGRRMTECVCVCSDQGLLPALCYLGTDAFQCTEWSITCNALHCSFLCFSTRAGFLSFTVQQNVTLQQRYLLSPLVQTVAFSAFSFPPPLSPSLLLIK